MITLLVIIIREIPLLKSSYCAALLILPEVFQYKDTPNLSAQVFNSLRRSIFETSEIKYRIFLNI